MRTLIKVCLILCGTLAVGCGPKPQTAPPEWPKLDTQLKPDSNVQPPAWYKAAATAPAWAIGAEPAYATKEWREWVSIKYNSTGLVRRANETPKIDGSATDELWKNAFLPGPMLDADGNPASPNTAVAMAYDTTHLYIAAVMDEPAVAKLQAASADKDAVASTDDQIIVILIPNWTQDIPDRYLFAVNSKGALKDTLNQDQAWNADVACSAAAADKAWTAELAIPLEAFGVKPRAAGGAVWACQITRVRYAGGSREVSTWTRPLNAAAAQYAIGHIKFEEPAAPNPPPAPPKDNKDQKNTTAPAATQEPKSTEPKK